MAVAHVNLKIQHTYYDIRSRDRVSCVWQVRDKISEYNAKGSPVAAAIVDPIQGEGGDRYATPYFFQQLQKILKQVRQLYIH